MSVKMPRAFVTGGCGFIGSHLVELLLSKGMEVVNLDALTYAGKEENVKTDSHKYTFIHGNICDEQTVGLIYKLYRPDYVFNLAAETHVDNSIKGDKDFIQSNIEGVRVLLREGLKSGIRSFVQVSTDEVYGSLPLDGGTFTEKSPLDPSSSYSASKTAGELLAMSYRKTFGMPVVVTRCCNNYGPKQHFEKLIPVAISNLIAGRPIPIYGEGKNVREWIYVADHAEALFQAAINGVHGFVYNIGSGVELTNVELANKLIEVMGTGSIRFVTDRLGHDLRYSVDSSRAREHLEWRPKTKLEEGLKITCEWYIYLLIGKRPDLLEELSGRRKKETQDV
jgi:dTDP-glucose 4,6-dehydratase